MAGEGRKDLEESRGSKEWIGPKKVVSRWTLVPSQMDEDGRCLHNNPIPSVGILGRSSLVLGIEKSLNFSLPHSPHVKGCIDTYFSHKGILKLN